MKKIFFALLGVSFLLFMTTSCIPDEEKAGSFLKDGRWQVGDSIYFSYSTVPIYDSVGKKVTFSDQFGNDINFHFSSEPESGIYKVLPYVRLDTLDSAELAISINRGKINEMASKGRPIERVNLIKVGSIYKVTMSAIEVRDSSGNGRIVRYVSAML